MSEAAPRVTYATLAAGQSEDFRRRFDEAVEGLRAGVVYVNRRAGATTGAWPGGQPFGGWKASGSTGKSSGGLYDVQQFLREQSRTLAH